jgi:GGDEF domain-containing protein
VSRYPEDGADAETLLEKADERMYDAKRRKKLLLVA